MLTGGLGYPGVPPRLRRRIGRQILDFHGRLYRIRRAQRRSKVDELLDLMELNEAADRKVKTYSGGMKRRLEIARSIMTDPEFLFIDEAEQIADTVGIMDCGRIVKEGTPSALIAELGDERLTVLTPESQVPAPVPI